MGKKRKKKEWNRAPASRHEERKEIPREGQESDIDPRGAEGYRDVSQYPFLEIPSINRNLRDGEIYEVLSLHVASDGVLATVRGEEGPVVYRLPDEYARWAQQFIDYAQAGVDLLPDTIEFGFDMLERRYYAKIRILPSA
jgi:hypothetical protein